MLIRLAWSQETPKRGGILSINLVANTRNVNPISNTSSSVMEVVAPCYNALVMYDPLDPDSVIGDLPQPWKV